MRIISWNVRGLGWGERRTVVKELVRRCMVDILCLQETKRERYGEWLMREIGSGSL